MSDRLKNIIAIRAADPMQEALHAAAAKLPERTAIMLFTYDPESGAGGYTANVDRAAALVFIGDWVERQRRMDG